MITRSQSHLLGYRTLENHGYRESLKSLLFNNEEINFRMIKKKKRIMTIAVCRIIKLSSSRMILMKMKDITPTPKKKKKKKRKAQYLQIYYPGTNYSSYPAL